MGKRLAVLIRRIDRKEVFYTKIKEAIEDFWWDRFEGPYRKYTQMWARVFYWGWKMRWSWDFEAHTIYDMLYYKLDKIYDCMVKHSHCVWNSDVNNNRMRKLCEAKHLANKLANFDEHKHGIKIMDKYQPMRKKGKELNSFEKMLDIRRPERKFIDDKLYSYMFKKAGERDRQEFKTTQRRLFYLLEKYMEQWWD